MHPEELEQVPPEEMTEEDMRVQEVSVRILERYYNDEIEEEEIKVLVEKELGPTFICTAEVKHSEEGTYVDIAVEKRDAEEMN